MSHEHPASTAAIQERVDYACVVASLAAIDKEVSDEELEALGKLCKFLALPADTTATVLAFAKEPDHTAVRDALLRLRDSPLRFTLIMDMVSLAYADGRYDLDERKQVRGLAAVLLVTEAEVDKAEDSVRTFNAEVAADQDAPAQEQAVETLAQVAAAGVPAATVLALSAAQGGGGLALAAGFKALALGTGLVPGVGIAVGLGLGSYYGVHYLYRRVVDGRES